MRARVAEARVARLATVTPEGSPHVVPICFAVVDDRIVSAVDEKPKTTTRLRRLENLRANPSVSLLVDHWDDDWSRLWWVRVDGRATVVDDGTASEVAPLLEALRAKYPRGYAEQQLAGPVVLIEPRRWTGWEAVPT